MKQENDIITSDFHPDSNMMHRESDKYILLIGSLSCMIKNKHINQTAFMIHVLDNIPIQNLFMELTGIGTVQELTLTVLNRYPQLCTSKTISNYIRGRNG